MKTDHLRLTALALEQNASSSASCTSNDFLAKAWCSPSTASVGRFFSGASALVLATLMMAIGGPAWAQVYKCVTSDGKIEFSNLGCQSKASAQVVRSTPNEIDASAQRNYLDRLEAQKLREQLDMQERTSKRLAQAQRIIELSVTHDNR